MVDISTQALKVGSVGALLINLGVMIQNGLEQGKLKTGASKIIGLIIFIIGWVVMAYTVGFTGDVGLKTFASFLMAGSIVTGVILSKMTKLKLLGLILFVVGWVGFGLIAGVDKTMTGKAVTLGAATMALASMLFVLPYQRSKGIIDGPGMSLFTVAWFLLIGGNAMVA